MKSLLFISILLAFGCNGEFNLYSILSNNERTGIKYIWQVEAQELLLSLVDNEDKETIVFQQALNEALKTQDTTSRSLVALFGQAYIKYSDQPLATLFSTEKALNIQANSSNEVVLEILQNQVDKLIQQHIIIVQKRIKAIGLYITKIAPIKNTDRFAVDIQNASPRTKEQIASIGKLELWEVYDNSELISLLIELNDSLKEEQDSTSNQNNTSLKDDFGPLFNIMQPNFEQRRFSSATIGYAKLSDKEAVINLLTSAKAQRIFGSKWDSIRFAWHATPLESNEGELSVMLYALNTKKQTSSKLNQTHIVNASVDVSPHGIDYIISVEMNAEGALIWENVTTNNVGRQIAITLDNQVYSAPIVNEPILNGHLSISGSFKDFETTQNICNVLSLKAVLPSKLVLIKELVYPPKD